MQLAANTTDPQHLAFAGQKGVIVNLDAKNTILLGPSQGDMFAGTPPITPLGPLNTIHTDGSSDVWAIALSGTPQVLFAENLDEWTASPAQVQAQLFANVTPVFNQPLQSVAASGSVTLGPFSISQIGYEANVQVGASSLASVPYGEIELTWSDSATGNIVARDRWALLGASGVNPQTYTGTGPSKGDTLSVKFTNGDINAMTFGMSLAQNSRVYDRDDFRNFTFGPVPGGNTGIYDAPAGLLLGTLPSIGSGGATVTRYIGLYAGIVALNFNINVGPFTADVFYETPDSGGTSWHAWDGSGVGTGGGIIQAQFALPRASCILSVTNNGTTGGSFTASIVTVEQPA